MSEVQQDAAEAAQVRLATLRNEGAARLDPMRFHALEALARRLDAQPEAVRRLLRDKLEAGVTDFAQRLAAAQPAAAPRAPARPKPAAACPPLAQLNAYLREVSAGAPTTEVGEARERGELASARRFRQAWAAGRTRDQVAQAAARKPANAGPLNSHVLVLQSLALMEELSPDYLRRFLVQVESLHWLEQARDKYPRQAAKPGKPTKAHARRKPKA
jgi:hypothetical protein